MRSLISRAVFPSPCSMASCMPTGLGGRRARGKNRHDETLILLCSRTLGGPDHAVDQGRGTMDEVDLKTVQKKVTAGASHRKLLAAAESGQIGRASCRERG